MDVGLILNPTATRPQPGRCRKATVFHAFPEVATVAEAYAGFPEWIRIP
jgi:hypothetical protein